MRNYIVFLLVLAIGITHSLKNEATLFDKEGNNITVSLSSDLKWKQFDQKATSVCVTGLMLFYSTPDFIDFHSYVYSRDNYCTNLKPARNISSIRYPGFMSDLKKDSITLYIGRDFTGHDKREYGSEFNDAYASSLILTGKSSWTVFDEDDFQGNSVCLIAPNPQYKSPGLLVSPNDIPEFGHFVRSGRKGCDYATTNTFELLPAARHGP